MKQTSLWSARLASRATEWQVIGMDPGPLPEIPTLPKEDRWSRGGPHVCLLENTLSGGRGMTSMMEAKVLSFVPPLSCPVALGRL